MALMSLATRTWRAALAGAFVALIAVFCTSAAAASLPVAIDFWGLTPDGVAVKPKQLTWATDVSQPDFGGAASANSAISWSSWTATSASGSGALWVPKLVGANGGKISWTSYPVTLEYSAPETLTLGTKLNATGAPYKTLSVFTTLKVTFTNSYPAKWSQSASFKLKTYPAAKSYKGFYGMTFPT